MTRSSSAAGRSRLFPLSQGSYVAGAGAGTGWSIPVADGGQWLRNRKALNPAFSRRNLNGVAQIVRDGIDDVLARWDAIADSGEEVDIYRELSILTMTVVQRSMFSSSVSDAGVPELVDRFRVQTNYMGGLMLTFWAPSWVPVPHARTGRQAVTAIRARIEEAIADRRANSTDAGDLLNTLLNIGADDGEPLEHENLVDQLMGLWFGGFDTTASALAWTVAMLAQNPDAMEALRAEADAYTGDFTSFADLAQLPYAKAAFDEAQRLQGALLLLTRQALAEDEIAGYYIPAGSQVGVSALHHQPASGVVGQTRAVRPDALAGCTQGQPAPVPVRAVRGWAATLHRRRAGLPRGAVRSDEDRSAVPPQPRPGWTPRHAFHLSVGLKDGLPGRIIHRPHGAA